MRFGGILEALSKHFGGVLGRRQSVFLILEAILQSVAIFDTFSYRYETALDSFLKGIWRTFKEPFACERH